MRQSGSMHLGLAAVLCVLALAANTSVTHLAKLTASDAGNSDEFGRSVAIEDDTIVVGAQTDDHSGRSQAGSAYVFARTDRVWGEQQKLTANDAGDYDYFGFSVAISGNTIVVGAPGKSHSGKGSAGSAYVFARVGGVWSQQPMLIASDPGDNDNFGYSVAFSDGHIVVGAINDDHSGKTGAGSAYVFARVGGIWSQQQKLTASDPEDSDGFGFSVAISGDTLVAGAFNDSHSGKTGAGSAYVFDRIGGVWIEQQRLGASVPSDGNQFGTSVAIAGNAIGVGAPAGSLPYADSAYVFDRNGASPVSAAPRVWSEQQKLTASDAIGVGNGFGRSVAISDDTIVVGADTSTFPGESQRGAAYVFAGNAGVWSEQQKLTTSDAEDFDVFGTSVAISGDTIIAGAMWDDHSGATDAGSVHVFGAAFRILVAAVRAPGPLPTCCASDSRNPRLTNTASQPLTVPPPKTAEREAPSDNR